jgi:hypothetical protein
MAPLIRIVTFWTELGTGSLMVIVYIGMLIHIRRGNNNKWLQQIIILLLLSSIFVVVCSYSYLRLNVQGGIHITLFNVYLKGISVGGQNGTYAVAHFFLAEKWK